VNVQTKDDRQVPMVINEALDTAPADHNKAALTAIKHKTLQINSELGTRNSELKAEG
jgi:hypothetical protein